MKSPQLPCHGFTLVELLVSIAILGVLASIGLVSYAGYVKQARDALRKDDISQLNNAIRQYFVYEGGYPPPTQTSGNVSDEVTGVTILQGRDRTETNITTFLSPLKTEKYIKGNPQDPLDPEVYPSRYTYYFNHEISPTDVGFSRWRDNRFLVYAYLENIHDADCLSWKNADGSLSPVLVNSGKNCLYVFDTGYLKTVQNP